jgi:hypothetical protein
LKTARSRLLSKGIRRVFIVIGIKPRDACSISGNAIIPPYCEAHSAIARASNLEGEQRAKIEGKSPQRQILPLTNALHS